MTQGERTLHVMGLGERGTDWVTVGGRHFTCSGWVGLRVGTGLLRVVGVDLLAVPWSVAQFPLDVACGVLSFLALAWMAGLAAH